MQTQATKKWFFGPRYGYFIRLAQAVTWPFVWVIARMLNRECKILIRPSDIDATKRYVVVANHGSRFDPFLILFHLPWRIFWPLAPARFFVYNQVFDSLLRPFMLALGCFPAKEHAHYPFGLAAATAFLNHGQMVFIFPEGKRHFGKIGQPRPGVAVLANLPNVQLIPVKIYWGGTRLRRYSLVIGQPLDAQGMTPEQIMTVIMHLEAKTGIDLDASVHEL